MAYVPGYQYDLFISYARENNREGWVDRFVDQLRQELSERFGADILVFYDKTELQGGQDFPKEILKALHNSAIFIPILSPHYVTSEWTRQERTEFLKVTASSPGGRIAPVLVRPVEEPLEVSLRNIQWTFFLSSNEQTPLEPSTPEWTRRLQQFAAGVADLLSALRQPRNPVAQITDTAVEKNKQDFAVVIGISRYPKLNDLRGAGQDARTFAEWLTDSRGGRVPAENIRLLVADEKYGTNAEDPHGVTRDSVDSAFEFVVQPILKTKGRIGRRLYIYMSGMGYGTADDVMLLMSDASQVKLGSAIPAKAYAEFFRKSGGFDEVILFVDCDRSETGYSAPIVSPPWTLSNTELTATKYFYAYAAAEGSHAFESQDVLETGGYGHFSHALLEGLRGRAADPTGTITSQSLGNFVIARLQELGDRQRPEIVASGSPIFFVQGKQAAQEEVNNGRVPAQPESERVTTHADDPATIDELGRRPFAEVIGSRIQEAWNAQHSTDTTTGTAFMVHIHGPWGSGKTSVLNFLRDHLKDPQRPQSERWIVITFNAWQQQRVRPPWWTLIKEIYAQSMKQLDSGRLLLRALWLTWRIRADWLPATITLALIALAVLLPTGVIHLGISRSKAPASNTVKVQPSTVAANGNDSRLVNANPAAAGATSNSNIANDAKETQGQETELIFKIFLAVSALGTAAFTSSRSLLFGSARAAQTFTELRSDPLSPIIRLFQQLVRHIRRPLAVFVDDLDRCESKYVVELLEGIQTLFRAAPVTYVVAADRKWICSSFEKTYEEFDKTIYEPGRPLGYLFLEKMFQVSASVPLLSSELKETYWQALLLSSPVTDAKALDSTLKDKEREALSRISSSYTQEELAGKITEAKGNPIQEQAMRAAAAKQITSAPALQKTEHRLRRFAKLLESNPRSMKRLVNAYGLRQAAQFLEGRSVSADVLALWTIVELRWPLLADFLALQPEAVSYIARGEVPTSAPKGLKLLFNDAGVRAVILGSRTFTTTGLDEAAIKQIVGLEGSSDSSLLGPQNQTSDTSIAKAAGV